MTTFTFFTITDPLGTNGNSVATGINDSGHIVGYYSDSKGTSHGFLDLGGIFRLEDESGALLPDQTDVTNHAGIRCALEPRLWRRL